MTLGHLNLVLDCVLGTFKTCVVHLFQRVWCKNGLSDNFGPLFTKPQNYLSSCNATVAKGLMLCSQHIILAIQMEFPPKEQQFSLLLTRKVKLPKCQEIPIISAGGKTLLFLPLVDGV